MNIEISLIIPLYNVEGVIRDCLESIIGQSFLSFEVILVDDGSTDNSFKICEEYCKKDIRFKYISKINGGVSSARNHGIDHAKGKYVFFLDADDQFEENNALEEMYKFIEKFQLDIVTCGHVTYNENNQLINTTISDKVIIINENSEDEAAEYIKKVNYTYIWGKLIKRDIIIKNNLKFNEDINFAEDVNFCVRCLLCTKNGGIINKGFYKFKRLSNISLAIKKVENIEYSIPNTFLYEQELLNLYIKDKKKLNNMLIGLQISNIFICISNNYKENLYDYKRRITYIKNQFIKNKIMLEDYVPNSKYEYMIYILYKFRLYTITDLVFLIKKFLTYNLNLRRK